jgi:hypothetical protein
MSATRRSIKQGVDDFELQPVDGSRTESAMSVRTGDTGKVDHEVTRFTFLVTCAAAIGGLLFGYDTVSYITPKNNGGTE